MPIRPTTGVISCIFPNLRCVVSNALLSICPHRFLFVLLYPSKTSIIVVLASLCTLLLLLIYSVILNRLLVLISHLGLLGSEWFGHRQ